MARCSLFELNETREESERESFLLKIFLGKSPRIIVFSFWKIVGGRVVQYTRSVTGRQKG